MMAPSVAPLSEVQAREVLRYWLASLRLEESLRVRPRARRPQPGSNVPRLDHPSPGQEYFKLPRAELQRLLAGEDIARAFDVELAGFFERWLLAQYRRGGADDDELAHVLCFPVVHLARGELAGLLRRGVKLRFLAGPTNFRVPSRNERLRGALPPAPDRVAIGAASRNEDAWPFFIDTRLLSHPLGVPSEHIDGLFEALRERGTMSECEMIALVASTLEDSARELGEVIDDVDADPLARLLRAMECLLRRSPARAEVYPVGIVVDGAQAKTTWHLQRELASLLDEDAAVDGVLGAYLMGRPRPAGEAPQRALYPGPTLTAHQRSAAESFWGSELSAVRGPPGTGKTTLVLHLCAEALVRQVDALLDGHTMGSQIFLITSGNNRAVDNVIDPLTSLRALPLALRVGSRQVCEHQLSAQLRGVSAWLAEAQVEPESLRQRAYARALSEYASLRERSRSELAPREQALAVREEHARIEQALAALPALAAAERGLPLEHARALEAPLCKLVQRLEALSELCSKKPTMAHVNAVARHYEKTAARDLPALEAALANAGMSLEVPLPPLEAPLDVRALMEAWEDGAETFLTRLERVRTDAASTLEHARQRSEREQLARRREALGPALPIPVVEHDEALARALFEAALMVRESWAKVHAAPLRAAVDAAAQLAAEERTLRPLFRDAPERATLLCQLFAVWGSTLLSIGNCIPNEPDLITHAVVDEAGQCHPAHVVSALLRADRALILGDVHQLPPVIDLTPDDDARLTRGLRLALDARLLTPYRIHGESQTSAQALADRAVHERRTLIDHFRCQPSIIAISDSLCGYGLKMHPRAADDASRRALIPHPVSLYDLRGEQQRHAGSLCNELELAETLQLVLLLLARGVSAEDIAVITPYRGQLDRLRQGLVERHVPLEQSAEHDQLASRFAHKGLALGTVHRFQGGERSIVLFSSVVTSPRSLGFLNERPNLLNVAISRAQQHFVCLGDRETLRRGPLTRVLVEAARAYQPS